VNPCGSPVKQRNVRADAREETGMYSWGETRWNCGAEQQAQISKSIWFTDFYSGSCFWGLDLALL